MSKIFTETLTSVSVLSVSTQHGDGGCCFEVNNKKATALNNPSDISVVGNVVDMSK